MPVPVWLQVRLLKVVLPVSVCVLLLPVRFTVLEPAVKVPALPQSPGSFMVVIVPAAKVPAVILMLPVNVRVNRPPPPVSVPPPLLTVKLLNVPPLLVQLPATLIAVAVPLSKVPEVNVIEPFSVSVVVLPPTASICAVFATVMPLKVWVVAEPFMFCPAPVFVKLTTLEAGVKVAPLLVQSPPLTVIDVAVPAFKVPAVNRTAPAIVSEVVLPPTVSVLPLLTVKLLNASLVAVPLMFCAPPPLKFTVPPLCVKVPVESRLKSPERFNVPAVEVSVPRPMKIPLPPFRFMVPWRVMDEPV